jgi:N-acetylglucosamine-6-phosphate deacetylase
LKSPSPGYQRLGVEAAVVGGAVVGGDVVVSDGSIVAVGEPSSGVGLAVPGFVDLQVNGFAGADFTTATPHAVRSAAEEMAATGVTTFLPTVISLDVGSTLAALRRLQEAAQGCAVRIPGAHLEGPFLNPLRVGAHDSRSLLAPNLAVCEQLLGSGAVAMMTVAPELAGALEVIALLEAQGVTISLGHSDASASQARAGFDAGARAVTHVFNAQRRWHHRDPGIAGVALVRDDVFVMAVVDGVHLDDDTVRLLLRAARERLIVVTDATSLSASDCPVGTLGGRSIRRACDRALLADGSLAGSATTMDDSFRRLVSLGADLPVAVGACSINASRLAGLAQADGLTVGSPADAVVLDEGLRVARTFVGGHRVF